jgi:hypothetical protein
MDGLEPHKSCFQHDPAVGLNRPNRESPCRLSERDVPIWRAFQNARYPPKNVDLGWFDSAGFLGAACNRVGVC